MKLITLYLPELYIKQLDELVDARFYPNRAEAIRLAIRDMLSVYCRFCVTDSGVSTCLLDVDVESRKSVLQKKGLLEA